MVERLIGHLLRGVAIACLSALFVLILVNIGARTFQLAGLSWFDEVVEGLFAWMVFIGSAALWRENEHFRVGWLTETLPPRAARPVAVLVIILEAAFLLAMTIYGYDLAERSRAATPILGLPTALFYISIPLAGFVMLAYSARDLLGVLRSFSTTTSERRTSA